jgi:DNA-binding MarR family transcriptional regulator
VIQVAAFRAALRSLWHETDETARAHGLTPQRYLLLLMIKGAPDGTGQTTIADLADRMKVEPRSVSRLVDRAVEAGLVERTSRLERSDVARVSLTAAGERVLGAVFGGLEAERLQVGRAFATFSLNARPAKPAH